MRLLRQLGLLAGLLASGCGAGEPQAQAPADCRLDQSCDPDGWTISIKGAPLRGGTDVPGLLHGVDPLDNFVPPTAFGGQQTVTAQAEYLLSRDEQPEFQLVFEDGAERVAGTANAATFRGTEIGRAKMFVEQKGKRSSSAFAYTFHVRPIESVVATPVAFVGYPNDDDAVAVADVASWINITLLTANGGVLVDEDITVTLEASQQTLERTLGWDLFAVPRLEAGEHGLVVETGDGQVFRTALQVVDGIDSLVVSKLDGDSHFEIDNVQGTTTVCVRGETNLLPLSLAEASFNSSDIRMRFEPLIAADGTPHAGFRTPWCRRLHRQIPGDSEFTVSVGPHSRTIEVSFN